MTRYARTFALIWMTVWLCFSSAQAVELPCAWLSKKSIVDLFYPETLGVDRNNPSYRLSQQIIDEFFHCIDANRVCVIGYESDGPMAKSKPETWRVRVWSAPGLSDEIEKGLDSARQEVEWAAIQLPPSAINGNGTCVIAQNMHVTVVPWYVVAWYWRITDGKPERYTLDISDPTAGFHFGGTPQSIVATMRAAWPNKFKSFPPGSEYKKKSQTRTKSDR